MHESLHPAEQRFFREAGAAIRNGLAVIGALAIAIAFVFGWHTYKALVMYDLYLNGV